MLSGVLWGESRSMGGASEEHLGSIRTFRSHARALLARRIMFTIILIIIMFIMMIINSSM